MKTIIFAVLFLLMLSCVGCGDKYSTNCRTTCGIDTCALYGELEEKDTIVGPLTIPFHIIKKNLGDNLSNLEYMDSVFGKPVSIHEDTYINGGITFGNIYEKDRELDVYLIDYLDGIHECKIITYNWQIDSLRSLYISYTMENDRYIPLLGGMYDILPWDSRYYFEEDSIYLNIVKPYIEEMECEK